MKSGYLKRLANIDFIIIAIMIFAIVRGLLYAFALPPWGLLDEEQHYDYLLKITQTGKAPIITRDYIDAQVAESILHTERHTKFHWQEFDSPDTKTWGLEGVSYEGYQGPTFYYLYSIFLDLIQGDILTNLFALRLITVLFSSVTIYLAFITTRMVAKTGKYLPYLVALLIAVIPERTMLTARLSNDSLLEILSMLFIYLFTLSVINGFKWKYVFFLAITTGLGITTKISFLGLAVLIPILFFAGRREKSIYLKATIAAGVVAIFVIPYVHYNLITYGDFTGYAGFAEVYNRFTPLWDPNFSLQSIISSSWQIFSSFWIVWWKSADSVSNIYLILFRCLLFILSTSSFIFVIRLMRRFFLEDKKIFIINTSYILSILSLVVLTGVGYFNGNFHVIQGRFIIPILFPIVFLITTGSSQNGTIGKLYLVSLVLLLIFDISNLFLNLIPYHYYLSLPYQADTRLVLSGLTLSQKFALFQDNFISDKPAWVVNSFVATLAIYIITLPLFIRMLIIKVFTPIKKSNGK